MGISLDEAGDCFGMGRQTACAGCEKQVDLIHLVCKTGIMKAVSVKEAKNSLSALLQEVARGETIVICRGGKCLAKLVRYEEPVKRPKVGEVIDTPFSIPDEALSPITDLGSVTKNPC